MSDSTELVEVLSNDRAAAGKAIAREIIPMIAEGNQGR
jgi:hypothetical protein